MDTVDKLKDYIKKNGLTQREMARRLDVTEVQINRWLKRRHAISRAWERIVLDTINPRPQHG